MNITRVIGDDEFWRVAARALLGRHIAPSQVCWRDAGDQQDSLFAHVADADEVDDRDSDTLRVTRRFLTIAGMHCTACFFGLPTASPRCSMS